MNKISKGGKIKRLVRGTQRPGFAAELVQVETTSVANVGRLHLVKVERDATGAAYALIDAESGYSLRQCKKPQGVAFLRRHSPDALAIYIAGMLGGKAAAPEGFGAAFDEVHAMLRELCS